MKRIFVFLILIAVLLNCIVIVPVFAVEPASVQAEHTSALAGQIVEYRVSISGNPGLTGLRIKLSYDETVFEVIELENEAGLAVEKGEALTTGNVLASKTTGGCQVFWYSTSESRRDGTLFTIRFKIHDAAALGTYPITLSYSASDTVNAAEQAVSLNVKDGSICVRTFAPTLYLGKASVSRGEEFDYIVCLQDDPGLASCGFKIVFDPEHFEFVTDQTTNTPIVTVGSGFLDGSIATKCYQNGIEVLWYAAKNTTACGALVSIRLRAKENSSVGTKTVRLSLNAEQILNEDEQKITLKAENGEITVCSAEKVTVQFPDVHTASISVSGVSGAHVIAAFYQENGQMEVSTCSAITNGEGNFTVNAAHDLSKCSWKIFILDNAFRPVSACFSNTSP